MGHMIDYRSFNAEKNTKAEIEDKLNYWAACECYQEGAGGLPERIKWHDELCFDSEEKAQQWISAHDHTYAQIAAKYTKGKAFTPSKTLESLKARKIQAWKDYNILKSKLHFADLKSQTISCKNCESKLNKKYLKDNKCPVCGKDLRPKSTLARINSLYNKYDVLAKEYDKKLAEEKKKKGGSDIYWLIKTEIHV